mmetsp:Transcript_28849/g.62839  ORF Transcript_28849/g.62839 Transcript_28849/m.62839 type:complete len:168 (+) Transcript_28849:82-585(+)
MAPQGKRGGRGRGDSGRQQNGGGGGGGNGGGGGGGGADFRAEARRSSGGGRGIPDFKDNPRARAGQFGASSSTGADGEGSVPQKFNAQDASDWLAQRYQSVMDEYEKQKTGSGKRGDIVHFSDLHATGSAWGASRPVIPAKEDFLFQLQQALSPYRQKQGDDKSPSA